MTSKNDKLVDENLKFLGKCDTEEVDHDLEFLKGSDQLKVEDVTYKLVKSYRVRPQPGASVTGFFTERKDLKDKGFEVDVGVDDDGPAFQVTKIVDLKDFRDREVEG